jgi:anaerobic magnesium-protoporphyrin IX monomethyl ester cyclase
VKIILINPPVCWKDVYGKFEKVASFQAPIGLPSLAAYLIQYGHDIQIIDGNVPDDRGNDLTVENIANEISKYPPDMVGLYSISYNYKVFEELANAIKKVAPGVRIVAGGPHATFMPKETLQDTPVEFCCLGEAEESLHELVQHLEEGATDFSDIAGLAYRTAEGEVVVNSERIIVKELDELPFPAIELLPPPERYKGYLLNQKRAPMMPMSSSRGCPYQCVFCETPSGKNFRANSPEWIADLMELYVKKFGIKETTFLDDTFTVSEKRVFEICELKNKRNIDLTWFANAHANVRDMDIFKAMKGAGAWLVSLGIESGSPKIIELLKKGTTKEQMKATSQGILDAKLKFKPLFIIGNPGETLESIEQTIQFAEELKGHFPLFSIMTPFPGAPLWDSAEEYGSFDRSSFSNLTIATSDPAFVPYGLTKEILVKKQKEAFRRVYFTLDMAKRHLMTLDNIEEFVKLVKASFTYLNVQFASINFQKKLNAHQFNATFK